MTDVSEQKQQLRSEILAKRDALPTTERATADEKIKNHLQALPAYQTAQTVFCFVSVSSEVNTRELIEEMLAEGKTVCAPRCRKGGIMDAYAFSGLDTLEESILSIPAPVADAPLVEPEDIDLVIVPCLTCSKDGYRLGYGGGYYDRYMKRAQDSAKIVLCRDVALSESVPLDAHDARADAVVTDKGVVYNTLS